MSVLGLVAAAAVGIAQAQSTGAPAKGGSAPAQPPLRLDVTLLPGSDSVYVEGTLNASAGKAGDWIAGAAGLPDPNELQSRDGHFRYAYSVKIPVRERSNSTESEISSARLRSWGRGIFIVPSVEGKDPAPIEVCIRGPSEWQLATSAGTSPCFTVGGVDELLSLPLLAGDVQVRTFEVAGAKAVLALRKDHPVSPDQYEERLRRLIEGASSYLKTPPQKRLFFGVDRLGDRQTQFPANNMSGPGRSFTLLIDDDSGTARLKYWGTYAHEYAHSWIPVAFGKPATTREELGSIFTEGFTDYLAYRIAFSSGLYDRRQFLAALSEFYLEYREAVAKGEKTNPEFLRYRQGMMAAWLLDIELLKASGGKSGFRELMRLLVDRHLGTDGITLAEMKDALRTLGGERVAGLYDSLTDIKRPVPFEAHLKGSGLAVRHVGDFTAAIDEGTVVVIESPRTAAERRFLERWLKG